MLHIFGEQGVCVSTLDMFRLATLHYGGTILPGTKGTVNKLFPKGKVTKVGIVWEADFWGGSTVTVTCNKIVSYNCNFKEGTFLEAKRDFKSDEKGKTLIKKGCRGYIKRIEPNGAAAAIFASFEKKKVILPGNFNNLKVLGVEVGVNVMTMVPILSDDHVRVVIPRACTGSISQVDKDGWLCVDFEGKNMKNPSLIPYWVTRWCDIHCGDVSMRGTRGIVLI